VSAHHFVEREGRRLHAAACWCWAHAKSPQVVRPAIRGPITPGDDRVPMLGWWRRWRLT
jgi:hypothetical protein